MSEELKSGGTVPVLSGLASGQSSESVGSGSARSMKIPKLALVNAMEEGGSVNEISLGDRSAASYVSPQTTQQGSQSTQSSTATRSMLSSESQSSLEREKSANISTRVFVTSDLTPHRFCAVVVKEGWQWDDFLSAASAKLSGGSTGGLVNSVQTGTAIAAANAVFLNNGAEIGSLDDLREDDQILLRFQKRLSLAPGALQTLNMSGGFGASNSGSSKESQSFEEESKSVEKEDSVSSYLPKDGIFRILGRELADVSPLSFSEELIADLVQDEMKLFIQGESEVNKAGDRMTMRQLFRDFLVGNDSLSETLLHTYDYLIPHHSFLSILIVHLRAPLVLMEAGQQSTGVVRPQPPSSIASRSNSVLPTYGLSISMTDPIRRGSAQTRIVNLLRLWLEIRYETVRDDLAALELLDDLIVYLCASPERLRAYGELIAQAFKRARNLCLSKERDLQLCTQAQLPKDKISFTRAVEVTPFELACQLTLADQAIFLQISISELQALQFDLPEKMLSPHIVEWVRHSSYITQWVVASILGPPGEPNPGPKKRASVLQHFVVAMDELRSMKSYNAMMQIYHALIHPAIERLEATWSNVSNSIKSILSSVSDMHKPPSSIGYVTLLQSTESPAIPYIEYHLNELRYIETSETVFSNGDIHTSKLERLSKSFKSVTRLQRSAFHLVPNAAYMSFIKSYEVPPVSLLIELSNILEPDANPSTSSASGGIAGSNSGAHATGSYSSSYGSAAPLSAGSSSTTSGNMAGGTKSARPISRSISDKPGTTYSHHYVSNTGDFSSTGSSSIAAASATGARDSGNFSHLASNPSGTASTSSNTSSKSGKTHVPSVSTGGVGSGGAPYSGAPISAVANSSAAISAKERKRKDSSAQKLVKEKEKEEEKRRKKWEKQAKKIRPLLTAALSLEQAVLNNDIYEQFFSYSVESTFVTALTFYKAVADFKRMFGSDAEPAARRTRDEANRIASLYLTPGGPNTPDFSSHAEAQIKDISTKAKGEQNLFTNNIFDPLTADLSKMLNTSWALFKDQRTSSSQ